VQDLKHPERFAAKLQGPAVLHNHVLTTYLNAAGHRLRHDVFAEAMKHAELLKPMMADVSRELNEAHLHGANLLFEGAQGTLLDVDHGTYPYVTSSNCVAGNAAAGAGVGPGMLHYILGITKAYCTRVGGGPFPTELDWEKPGTPGYHMSTVGAEKGVTTGRSRRCGWFDAACSSAGAGQWPVRPVHHQAGRAGRPEGAQAVHRLRAGWRTDRHPAHGCGRDFALQARCMKPCEGGRQHRGRDPV
jgi:adenylosuccinate synthase